MQVIWNGVFNENAEGLIDLCMGKKWVNGTRISEEDNYKFTWGNGVEVLISMKIYYTTNLFRN